MGNNESNLFVCFEDNTSDENTELNASDGEVQGDNVEDDQLVWEFQRFQPNTGWAAGGNFNSADPGRYASYNRKIFGESLQTVAPIVPPGYNVDQNWKIVIQKRVRKIKLADGGDVDETGITDKFGWHYGDSFLSSNWYDIAKYPYFLI